MSPALSGSVVDNRSCADNVKEKSPIEARTRCRSGSIDILADSAAAVPQSELSGTSPFQPQQKQQNAEQPVPRERSGSIDILADIIASRPRARSYSEADLHDSRSTYQPTLMTIDDNSPRKAVKPNPNQNPESPSRKRFGSLIAQLEEHETSLTATALTSFSQVHIPEVQPVSSSSSSDAGEELDPVTKKKNKAFEENVLPHVAQKDIYNKDGRVGIYTPEERKSLLEKFKQKRQRRVWTKKIRYACRKGLADSRLRIKGRFVKMTPEQAEAYRLTMEKEAAKEQAVDDDGQPYVRQRRYTIA